VSNPDVKAAHRAMWAEGDYPAVAATISSLGRSLVEACGVRAGQRVLDVAAGAGNTAIPAAAAGADVVASDLTPELFVAGRAAAAAAEVQVEWVEADAEALPFGDASFDVVLSSVGAMFAPDHQRVADELLRVCRPGGTIGMANWTPDGWVGAFFRTLLPFMAPPPDGSQPPVLWGSEDHVRRLFGDRVSDLTAQRRTNVFEHDGTPQDVLGFYRERFGPTITMFRDQDDPAALEAAFGDFLASTNAGPPGGPARYVQEYLLVVAHRA
jgi:ubiquinone/menaquinone biosynthesis C-methylase UbiE